MLRLLLVEDNPANQKLAAYILQERGHTVEIAGSGGEALCMAERSDYNVILMDVSMPGMDGLEATAAIRKREAEAALQSVVSGPLSVAPLARCVGASECIADHRPAAQAPDRPRILSHPVCRSSP